MSNNQVLSMKKPTRDKALRYTSPSIPGLHALSCSSDFIFEKHLHSGHVLWLNSEGGETYTIKGSSSVLQPGCLSVIEPGVVHSNRPSVIGKRHLRSLYLEEEFFRYLEKLVTGSETSRTSLPTKLYENRGCWEMTLQLHEALISTQEKLLLEEHVVSLFESLAENQLQFSSQRVATLHEDKRIQLLLDYMRAHLETEVSLDMLGKLAQCTPFHIIRLFKEKLGLSPHAYFVQLRLERARELIDTGHSLSDAAFLAGFADQSHLTRRFKKRYGLTPGVYLEQKFK